VSDTLHAPVIGAPARHLSRRAVGSPRIRRRPVGQSVGMRRRRKSDRKGQAVVLAGAAAAAASIGGGAVVLARRRTTTQGGARRPARRFGRRAPGPDTWTCTCGTAFRVTGAGRHQVFWLADAPEDEPVMGDRCPSCDRPLPGATGSGSGPDGATAAEAARA
jgi:hypothetical protein